MKELTWKVEKRKVADLKNWDENPRKITDEGFKKLKARIIKRGFHDVVKTDGHNVVLSGNQRKRALAELGVEEVFAMIPSRELTEEEKNAVALESNRNDGSWDWDMMANNFDSGFLFDLGFTENELAGLTQRPEEKDEEVPEVPKVAKSKTGQLYKLGEHRLLCGDATNEHDYIKLMDGKQASMCFTDPPYNVDYQGGMGSHEQNKREGIQNDSMSKDAFAEFIEKAMKQVVENTEGGIYVCMSSSELDSLKKGFENAGGHWQSFIIWVKNNFTLSRADYQNTYEPILYGWRKGVVNHYFTHRRDISNVWEDLSQLKTEVEGDETTISFQGFKVKIKGKIESGEVVRKKQYSDIWRFDKPTKSAEHPTMKPVELVTEAIVNSSLKNQIVLDPFLGSGSTLISAEKNERICYGMELDPKYVDVIIKRWEEYTGGKAELIG